MDVKHRKFFGRIKLIGVKEPIMLEAASITQLSVAATIALSRAPNVYQGHTIEHSPTPFGEELNELEQHRKEMYAGLDMSLVEMATPEEEAMADGRWNRNPMNPHSPTYDPLFHEYQMCSSPSRYASKGPEDLALLRKHMETHYAGSEWWDGSHRW